MSRDDSSARGSFLETYSQADSGLKAFHAQGMGTENVLLLAGSDEGRLQEAAREAFDLLDYLEQVLSKFLPDSDISLLNSLGATQAVRLGSDTLRLLKLSRQAWEISDGAFDPTLGGLLDAWGFVDMEGRIPGDAEIEQLLRARGMNHVIIDDKAATARLDRPGVSVDLGGIGKGYAVDAMGGLLKDRGVEAGAVISGRSSVLAWGAPPGEDRWEFDAVHPDARDETLATLEVEAGVVSSSAASERRFVVRGRDYGHVLDPRTGRPARRVKGVTVWTESALLGDVLSTTLFVLGKEALGPQGCASRLAEAWKSGDEPARASVLLLEEDPGVWGGLQVEVFHIGLPGFRLR